MITIYGIKNCATMKKTFDWCAAQGIDYNFHDYKTQGVPLERLRAWCRQVGFEVLVNRRGTTWRKLSPAQQDITTQAQAVALMRDFPSVIKRPVVVVGETVLVGFDAARLDEVLTAGAAAPAGAGA